MSAKAEYNKQRENENSEQLPWKYEKHVHIVESVLNRQTLKKKLNYTCLIHYLLVFWFRIQSIKSGQAKSFFPL